MNVTLGILAHVDAGKTTLSEQILYTCGALRRPGRVDHRDTCLDFDSTERRRGITIYSAQAAFSHGENTYYLVDTPGHADFLPELERCLSVLDYAILVVSAPDGVQAGTLSLWRLLEKRNIPVILFLNKTDSPHTRVPDALSRLSADICELSGGLNARSREQIAMTHEAALDAFLEGSLTDDACWEAAARAVRARRLFPLFAGSALRGDGVETLLRGLDLLCRTQYSPEGEPRTAAYQIRHDRQGNRLVFMKVLEGTARAKQMLGAEKINELRRYQGNQYTAIAEAKAGEIVAVTGLRQVHTENSDARPLLLSGAEYAAEIPTAKVLEALRELEDEEPTLAVRHHPVLGEIHVAVMGEIQLEVLTQTLAARFGLAVRFGPCRILYQETVARPLRGCGHYEPLRHYAEVHLLLEPGPRGSGITFESRCSGDVFAPVWQKQVRTHVLEKQHVGALTGMPLTDVHVVLLAGAAHEKHTEGGDFREAVYRAIRQALFAGQSVLLEPYYRFWMETDAGESGKLLTDLLRLHATCAPPQTHGLRTALTGRAPVAAMLDYCRGFPAMTRGRGLLCLKFDGYEPCQNAEAVIAAMGYDRERDVENTADSVFCAHGAGYHVKWCDAPSKMDLTTE